MQFILIAIQFLMPVIAHSNNDTALKYHLRPFFEPSPNASESLSIELLISKLALQKNPEGGYYAETDRDPWRVPNPFPRDDSDAASLQSASSVEADDDDSTRSASTTIYYLLTPENPTGVFHRNKARIIHTLHQGRGRYVIIHADETLQGQKEHRIETFLVGRNIHEGERLQWVVEGGTYKASFLLPDTEGGNSSEGLLISEVNLFSELWAYIFTYIICFRLLGCRDGWLILPALSDRCSRL